tara:strand:+ start:794 stop:1444 length:651 start_codon:yes stop_codon:yes gene_type:complete
MNGESKMKENTKVKYRNIPAKVRKDPMTMQIVYKSTVVDKENNAKLSPSFIKKYGKCFVDPKDKVAIYDSSSLYRVYKRVGKIRPEDKNKTSSFFVHYKHRIVFSVFNITVPLNNNDYQVHHLCSNTKCHRPNHLELISTADNQAEKATRVIDRLKIDIDDKSSLVSKLTKSFEFTPLAINDFDFGGEYQKKNLTIDEIVNHTENVKSTITNFDFN